MNEEWKGISGYDHDYRVSTLGRVIGTRGFLKPYDNGYGYLVVELRQNGKKKHLRVHRLVAEAFVPNPQGLPEVNHKDEDKYNNLAINLEWCTQGYNLSYNNGHKKRAESRRWFYDELSVKFKENNPAIKLPVIQMSLDGEFIKEWPSAKDATTELGYESNHICECCKNQRKTSNGFRWKYKEVI